MNVEKLLSPLETVKSKDKIKGTNNISYKISTIEKISMKIFNILSGLKTTFVNPTIEKYIFFLQEISSISSNL